MTWQTLPARARVLFYLQAFSRFALLGVPLVLTATAFVASWWSLSGAAVAGLGVLGLMLLWTLWMPALAHARWAWWLREDDLLVAHGVLVRQVEAIPAQRIQHVDVRQGLLEQWLGLARVHVYTASGSGADGVIPGLPLAEAEALRDRLVGHGGDDGV